MTEQETTQEEMKSLSKNKMHYCPGCSHVILNRMIAEVIDEMGLREKTIASAPVGCSVLLYDYFTFDVIECLHGRVPSVMATIKRLQPDKFVLCYQGDGDLAAIGLNETIQTANRGENLSVIFVNNAIYGMTGGHMAPTTLPGQKTLTTQDGRPEDDSPLKMCELIATLDKPVYVARVACNNADHNKDAKAAIKKAFQCQLDGKGYSFVEILSTCHVGWKVPLKDALGIVQNDMIPYFPLGVFKDNT